MHCKSYSHFFSKNYQNICVSLDVNFNESLTNDIVSFEQLGPGPLWCKPVLGVFNFHIGVDDVAIFMCVFINVTTDDRL